ncbi:MAG TPA: CRTAC1 family protein [Planctomycetaceae bacterium]
MTRPNPLDRTLHRPAGKSKAAPAPQPAEPAVETAAEEVPADDAVIGRAFRISLGVIVLLAAAGGAVAWWLNRPEPTKVTEAAPVSLPQVRSAPKVDPPKIPFTDVTEEAGITFVHENGAAGEKLLPETMGGGVGVLDYDSDGDNDLLFVNSKRWPWDARTDAPPATCALYANDGTGRFADVSKEAGLDVSLYGMGCAIGDYDNDGDPDVYLSAVGSNRLLRNDGGRFVDITEQAGVAGPADAWGTSCGWFDYDGDGRLDLFVCNYVVWSREYDLAQNFQLTGGGRAYGRPQSFEGTFPLLFRNKGDGTFEDVSASAGLHVKNPALGRPMAKSLGLTFADFDRDGDLDVVVANDTVQNFLFENRGDGTFEEIGNRAGIAFDVAGNARGAMGVDCATFRGGEAVGVAIGNFANEMTALYVTRPGETNFTDEAVANGLGPQTRLELTFGVLLADFDLDGRPDYFGANGHLEEEINRVQPSQHYEQPPHFFWNCGPEHATEFCPLTAEQLGEEFFEPTVGRGAAYADFDGDGDLDLVLAATGRPARLLRNDLPPGRRWLRLKLVGSKSNRDAIGAAVTVVDGGDPQTQTVMPTRSYLSQVEPTLTFGLGEGEPDQPVERIEIAWPSGRTTTLENVETGKTHVVEEP